MDRPVTSDMSAQSPYQNTDLLHFCRSEIRFESEMVGVRLSALVNSQSFLVIAYATSMTTSASRWGNALFLLIPPLLSALGFVLALLAWPGIRAAYAAIGKWEEKEAELHRQSQHLSAFSLASSDPDARATLRRGQEGARFALCAPGIFLATWCLFGYLPFYLCYFH
ncbi:hypothetical protein GOB93_06300 [Acetobacter musti]|uniref:Uncharacterized protein n=1 Tax=Acetobacter musti TaxID=864732 RepID=A0ABX0JL71_9PROT|nr:hypothetical protein [Acetobacter musti]NHN84256.1 hypothetical protein [Acetobacter musti]